MRRRFVLPVHEANQNNISFLTGTSCFGMWTLPNQIEECFAELEGNNKELMRMAQRQPRWRLFGICSSQRRRCWSDRQNQILRRSANRNSPADEWLVAYIWQTESKYFTFCYEETINGSSLKFVGSFKPICSLMISCLGRVKIVVVQKNSHRIPIFRQKWCLRSPRDQVQKLSLIFSLPHTTISPEVLKNFVLARK